MFSLLLLFLALLWVPSASAEPFEVPKLTEPFPTKQALIVSPSGDPFARYYAERWKVFLQNMAAVEAPEIFEGGITTGTYVPLSLVSTALSHFDLDYDGLETYRMWLIWIGEGEHSADGRDLFLYFDGGEKTFKGRPGLFLSDLIRDDVTLEEEWIVVLDLCNPNLEEAEHPLNPRSTHDFSQIHQFPSGTVLLESSTQTSCDAPFREGGVAALSQSLLSSLIGAGDLNGDDVVSVAEAIEQAQREFASVGLGSPQFPLWTPLKRGEVMLSRLSSTSGCQTGLQRSVSTHGECCWTGQKKAAKGEPCEGIPNECPKGFILKEDTCTIENLDEIAALGALPEGVPGASSILSLTPGDGVRFGEWSIWQDGDTEWVLIHSQKDILIRVPIDANGWFEYAHKGKTWTVWSTGEQSTRGDFDDEIKAFVSKIPTAFLSTATGHILKTTVEFDGASLIIKNDSDGETLIISPDTGIFAFITHMDEREIFPQYKETEE